MEKILLTFAISAIVGFLFFKLKFPGGFLVGAVVGSTVLSVGFHMAEMPYLAKFAAQATAGAFIGVSFEREDLKKLRHAWKPALAVLSSMMLINIMAGFTLVAVSHMDLLTALLSGIPGGVSNTPLIAAEVGAVVSQIVFIQFIRMCAGIGVFPSMVKFLTRHEEMPDEAEIARAKAEVSAQKAAAKKRAVPYFAPLVLAVAAFSGWLGRIADIPAGPLVFSMIGVFLLKLTGITGKLPMPIKRVAQVLSGAYIGCSISYEDVLDFPRLIIPAMIVVAFYMVNSIVVGNFISRKFSIPKREALLMVTPAGASDMALISSEIGVHSTNLVILQIVRMLCAVSIFPAAHIFIASLLT